MEKESNKLQLVIKEIVDTENEYINKLQTVVDIFIIPLKQSIRINDPILDENEIQVVFSCWEVLCSLHTEFYNKLLFHQKKKSLETNIGSLFLEFADHIKIYKNYLINFSLYQEHRAALLDMNNGFFNRKYFYFIQACRANRKCEGRYLEMFLIEPVQRLPRYELLLQRLIKYMNPTPASRSYISVSQASVKLSNMMIDNNNTFSKLENRLLIMRIMQSVDPKTRINLLEDPERKLIKYGDIQLLHNK